MPVENHWSLSNSKFLKGRDQVLLIMVKWEYYFVQEYVQKYLAQSSIQTVSSFLLFLTFIIIYIFFVHHIWENIKSTT